MAAEKRNFWTTVQGIISGVAAIVTGLGVLIPLLLGVGSKHTNKNTQSPPGVTSPTGTESPTSTAGGGTTGNASPLPTDSSSPFSTDSPSDSSSSSGGPLAIAADPSSVNFGSIQQGKPTPDKTVSINNPGSAPVTIDKVEMDYTLPAP